MKDQSVVPVTKDIGKKYGAPREAGEQLRAGGSTCRWPCRSSPIRCRRSRSTLSPAHAASLEQTPTMPCSRRWGSGRGGEAGIAPNTMCARVV